MKTGSILLSVLGGVAAGAVLGVLFAPDKGIETRRKIARTRDDLTGAIKERVNSFVEGVSSTFGTVTDEAEDLVAVGREKADLLKNRTEDNLRRETKSF